MLTSISTTAMSVFSRMFKRLACRRRLDQVLTQIREDHLVAQELGWLIVHHQDVDFLSVIDHCSSVSQRRLRDPGSRRQRTSLLLSDAATCAMPTSSCSVLTGLARYSDAPASRHRSRSPFMALAVSAMMGKRRKRRVLPNHLHGLVSVHFRHHDVHQHDGQIGR